MEAFRTMTKLIEGYLVINHIICSAKGVTLLPGVISSNRVH